MLKEIIYPDFTLEGIKPLRRDYPLPKSLRLFGCDTETLRGRPYTVQAHDGRETMLAYVSPESVFEEFWEWVRPRCRENGVNIAYFHKANFDFRVLFAEFHRQMYEQFSDITLRISLDYKPMSHEPTLGEEFIEVKMLFGKVNTARIYQGSMQRGSDGVAVFVATVKLDVYDSFAFTQCSLAKSIKMFGIEGNKLPKPEGLGRKALKSKEFEAYAKMDAVVEYRLGEKILAFHEEYKTRPAISLSQFSGRVFRRYFFDKGGTIQHPPEHVSRAAELSYHAGKNGRYFGKPRIVEDVYEVDINSAFPFAMAELPQMVKGEFKEVKKFRKGKHGLYCVSGKVLGGRYPLVFTHDFKAVEGEFKDLWITSYELERIQESPWVVVTSSWGYVWEPGRWKGRNAFSDFVRHFYAKKDATPKSDPHYHFYKIILNALYGRFAASIEERNVEKGRLEDNIIVDDLTGKKVWGDYRTDPVTGELVKTLRTHRAGGMTNFFVASLITGRTRAMLYDLETKYEALHSATDSIKTTILPDAAAGLGGHKVEAFGRCYFFRNKLYLHFSKGFDYCGHRGKADLLFDGEQHLCKAAYHGFKGDPKLIFSERRRLLATHHLRYGYEHCVGLREGLKKGEQPGDFLERKEVLCLCDGEKSERICREAGYRCHCPKDNESSSRKTPSLAPGRAA